MSRRGRRKITYDSGETKLVLGLISLFFSVLALLSNFTDGIFLIYLRQFFGGAIFFASGAFLILSLRLFNFQPERITNKSVIGIFLLTIAWATYLNGGTNLPINIDQMSFKGDYGGQLGFYIAQKLGTYFFQDMIRPFMLVIMFLSVPMMLSMRLLDYFAAISQFFKKIWDALSKIKQKTSALLNRPYNSDEVENTEEILENGENPVMVSDLHPEDQEEILETEVADDEEVEEKTKTREEKMPQKPKEIQYKETDEGKDILMQTELKFPKWKLPPISLLDKFTKKKPSVDDIRKNSKIIEQTLESFGINTKVVDVLIGPSVTQYALNIALGTKVSKIANLRNDLALALATSANAVRIEAPIPGTSFVGIEVPNREREMITFRELIEDKSIDKNRLGVTIGKNVPGENVFGDIQKMPHLLIAGATGSGKSVVTNSFIMSLLMQKSPDFVRFILVDPKQVEMSDYNGIAHLLTPVITDMDKVNNALKWAITEMERRYTEFREFKVRNIEDFNSKMGFSALPYIVIVIDEMADMMMTQHGAEIESSIVRLAQKARATGIHLILATQRPSVDVITGLIKANIPGRIGMSVTTQIDSRVILDQVGAEALLGRGDMLYKDPGKGRLERIQACFISQEEVTRVVNFIKEQTPEVEYSSEVTKGQASGGSGEGENGSNLSDDQLFIAAARVVINSRKGSSSLIQRKLSVGYNRAARLLDELEEHGIVGPANGSKPRDILITDLEAYLKSLEEVR